MSLNNICVFLGSSAGNKEHFSAAARDLGHEMARRKIHAVYGGGNVGLMGVLADSMVAQGGAISGVIPTLLEERELAHRGLTHLHVVDSMHERKKLMAQLADAFIALPGGLGTLEEVFEALTWNQIGVHAKPCGLLNVGGYFDSLLRFLDHTLNEGFISAETRSMVLAEDHVDRLIDALDSAAPPPKPKFS